MWMVGVLLLLLTMGFAFTGYLLPWDQNAYWATQVGINMVGSVPFVGTFLVRVMRGVDTLGALSLSRFFAVRILFLPAAIMVLIALHMFSLRRVGPAGPWSGGCGRRCKPGDASLRQGRRAASAEERPPIEGRVHSSEPFNGRTLDRKSTRLNSSHLGSSYAVFFLKKKKGNGDTNIAIFNDSVTKNA